MRCSIEHDTKLANMIQNTNEVIIQLKLLIPRLGYYMCCDLKYAVVVSVENLQINV